ncbi:hypothetical protein B0H15DRAFT_950483 [Mycena belliarum]|uniref:Uncharacterized protein n=1 Tax=Mycena belliarum TaxID=1033014 RepID=A0AAD6XQ54_9AGAR|nr:hypothetical protein B0H15DRAFT_950483 [Mycena belliae]
MPVASSGSAVNRVPFEIWLQVKNLVRTAESNEWYSVNRAWFEIVMNARYRVLDVADVVGDEVKLRRLSLLKDPGMAKRVRSLSISGFVLQNSLLSNIMGHWIKFPMDRNTLAILNRRLEALDSASVLDAQARLVSEVLSGLSCVSEYSVKWDYREGTQAGEIVHSALQAAILDAAWSTFGANLKKLTVSVRPERFNVVLSSEVQLALLEDLQLELLQVSGGAQALGIHDLFPDYVVSFFARANPHLETLSIQSSSNLDLSCLFHCLPPFKHIRRLLLHIFLDHDVLSDASGLGSFFAHSAQRLRHLSLSLYHAAVSAAERILPTLAMTRAFAPCLETLEVNFGMPHPVLEQTLLRELHDVFRGTRGTLHTLVLEGIALSYTDLQALVAAFADREVGDTLQRVTLSTLTLTAWHIDALAMQLPRISTLGIIFTHLSLYPDGPPEAENDCRAFFEMDLRNREYPHWELRDISIWHRSRSVDTSRWDLVKHCSACIPTISHFFGQPLPENAQTRATSRVLDALPQA